MRIAVLLLLLPLLAGCLGGSAHSDVAEPPPTHVVEASPTTSATAPLNDSQVPKYHPHDLWGGRTSVDLFVGYPVVLGQDPQEETSFHPDEGAVVSGYREFDMRADGDDSSSVDKADTVYQGTNAIVVKLEWAADQTDQRIPGITFLYKPANSVHFTPLVGAPNGQEFSIPVGKGMADMPHQLKLTRWKFALEAYDPTLAGYPEKAYVAHGTVKVTMRALNGGVTSLDPPHPYNFLSSREVAAGEVHRSIDVAYAESDATGGQFLKGEPSLGWHVDAPYIVPWETTTLKVTVDYKYTGSATALAHALALRYSDAGSPEVKSVAPKSTAAGTAYYEIEVKVNQADDPYATRSDWTWGVVPVTNGQVGGEFQGDVTVKLLADGEDPVS